MKTVECPHCGVKWTFGAGSADGFIWSHIATHQFQCKHKSPEERRRWLTATEKRILRNPPQHTTYQFPLHSPEFAAPTVEAMEY